MLLGLIGSGHSLSRSPPEQLNQQAPRDPFWFVEQAISLLEYGPDGRPGAFGCGELSRELFPDPALICPNMDRSASDGQTLGKSEPNL